LQINVAKTHLVHVNSIRTSWDLQALKENRRAVDNTSTSWKSVDNVAWTMSKSDL